MCSLKFGKKKDKLPPVHLKNYLQTILNNLDAVKGQDMPTEALLYALGNLHETCAFDDKKDILQMV